MKVSEFKIWLEGVLAFQDDRDNWKPTAKQWKAIFEKIQQLEENVYVEHVGQTRAPPQQPQTFEQPLQSLLVDANPNYTQFSPEKLEAMKRQAANGLSTQDMIAVPIDPSAVYRTPFA